MQITDIRMRLTSGEERMKAWASITLDGEFVIHDVKVINGDKGLFIAMPSKRNADGEFKDIAHPINSDMRKRMQAQLLAEYERLLAESEG